jgi:hypothetical protein
MFSDVRSLLRRITPTGLRGWAALTAAAAVLAVAAAGLAGAFSGSSAGSEAAGSPAAAGSQPSRDHGPQGAGTKLRPGGSPSHRPSKQNAAKQGTAKPATAKSATPKQATKQGGAADARGAATRTSCRSVAHIGDSTSVGLVSPDYLPDPAQRLRARYADVGVRSAWIDASGGRSIVETMPGQANGYEVASSWVSQGYRGCWVIALGTNDTANVSVGSSLGRLGRIERMMAVAHGEPVLWVNVKTLDSTGPWAESNMQIWNSTLRQACTRYPNLRIFDWASVAQDGWFISDGIHYTSVGYAARARMIAAALARAFPQGGRSHSCVVR